MLSTEAASRKDARTGISPMQHRNFTTIATIISELNLDKNVRFDVARQFADRLAFTNPKFDRQRFLVACGVIALV